MSTNLSENLKFFRQHKGLKQFELAKLIGVAPSTYSQYEAGTREPNVLTLKKIAIVLNATCDELIGYSQVENTFLQKLDQLLEEHNLNKSTLSKNCGIPYTTIDGWYKKDYEDLKLVTLKKLSSFFNVPLDFWQEEYTEVVLTEDEKQIIIKYREMKDFQLAIKKLLDL